MSGCVDFCLYEPKSENVTRLSANSNDKTRVRAIKKQSENKEREAEKHLAAARKMQEVDGKDFRMCLCSRCTRSPGIRFCSRCRGSNKPRFRGPLIILSVRTDSCGASAIWEAKGSAGHQPHLLT